MFGGDHIIFRRIKGGISSKLRTQKWGSLKTLEGFRGETTHICSENEDMVGGGRDRESHEMLLGGIKK